MMKQTIVTLSLGALTLLGGGFALSAADSSITTLIITTTDEKVAMPKAQDFIANRKKDRPAYCIVAEDVPLSVKRALRMSCIMQIVSRTVPTADFPVYGENLRALKGETRVNVDKNI